MEPLTKGKIYKAELFNDETNEVFLKEDVLFALALAKEKMNDFNELGIQNIQTYIGILDECFQIK